MIYERRYVQFNDLVFDNADMISDADGDLSFKGSSTEYSYGHGSYRPFKANYLYVKERTVSLTITLHLRNIPCEFRNFYSQFVIEELGKPGKLWSVKNNELMWANAAVESVSENYSSRQDILIYDVNFVIPGGIWHKADKQKTFLVPYNICDFMECKGYKTINPCRGAGDCCEICTQQKIQDREDCSCCCSDDITEDMALCYHLDDLQNFYSCNVQYQIVYDCIRAEKFSKEKYLGQKLCVDDVCESSIIAGRIYSETDIPTDEVTVIITGKMKSPWVTINGNTNIITGTYDGTLIIKPSGDVYYEKSDCCEPELLSPSVWVIPKGNEYGWTINPGTNSVIIQLNVCCGAACVFIQHDAITM